MRGSGFFPAHCSGAMYRRVPTSAPVCVIAPMRSAEDGVWVELGSELSSLLESVRSEKMGELAAKFDSIHSIQRAVEVGSVSSIVAAADLRPYLVSAIERGMAKAEAAATEVVTA